jgi:hypothetical protein
MPMLTHDELVDLYRTHRQERVLSIYLHAEEHDPADRKMWRRVLDHAIAGARDALDGDAGNGFSDAVETLEAELSDFDNFLPDRGWVGFATADRLLYAETVHVPMPNLVRWEHGLRVAPYVRALKQSRVVVTLVADSRKARVYTYRDAQVKRAADLHVDTYVGDLTDANTAKRATTHSGVRGVTATDTAQRIHEVGTERMLKELLVTAAETAGERGFIVLGGTPEIVGVLSHRLPRNLQDRAIDRPALSMDMSDSEVREVTEEAATVLTSRRQSALLEDVIDAARSGGRGCLGREDTETALRDGRVDTLLLSRRITREDPDMADRFVGASFEHGGDAEELGDPAAGRLDEAGNGIGARLRYRI